MFRPPIPAVISSIMFDVALDKMPKPKITGTARLVDIRDMQAQWTLDEPYELITTTPIPPKEQVSQLLAIMLNTIEDELDFFE